MKKCPVCGFSNFDPNITCEKCGYQFSKDADLAPLNNTTFNDAAAHCQQELARKSRTYQPKAPISQLRTCAKVFMMIPTVSSILLFVSTFIIWFLALASASVLGAMGDVTVITLFVFMICCMIIAIFSTSMTVHYFRVVYDRGNVGIGFKICTLLFVSLIAGILMLCDDGY